MLCDPDPKGKVHRTREAVSAWRAGDLSNLGDARPPDSPARPVRPELKAPRDMPRRRKGGIAGRRAFVHAIAHIEFNAIDLAWDMVARFENPELPRAFYDDWVGVAHDEAEHFALLSRHLVDMGITYGDLPAHNGLWEATSSTHHDVLARLALVPMVLEARGLDTTPTAVARLEANGDAVTAAILEKIGREEMPHVAAGVRWFEHVATNRGLDPVATFHDLVAKLFAGSIKPPFNAQARIAAGMSEAYFRPYENN